jgi:small subunit ribosomal protein S14|tara:strand:- start:9847 stop:10131 length:285 start_codon:yes stop_codon:yes gene_type:complete
MQKYLVVKEKKNRLLFTKIESELNTLKIIVNDCRLSLNIRWLASLRISQKKSLQKRLVNRCFITGRAAGYNRFFRLSRLQLREKASKLSFVKKI